MEQNDMLSAWQEINEKLNNQEIISKKTLTSLLENNRKSSFQKLITLEKGSACFMCVVTVLIGVFLIPRHTPVSLNIQAMILLLSASAFSIIRYFKLRSIHFEDSVTHIFKKACSYRKIITWNYIVIYILALLLAVNAWVEYPIRRVLISILVIGGIFVDYVIFHWTMRNINEMTSITKELKELGEK